MWQALFTHYVRNFAYFFCDKYPVYGQPRKYGKIDMENIWPYTLIYTCRRGTFKYKNNTKTRKLARPQKWNSVNLNFCRQIIILRGSCGLLYITMLSKVWDYIGFSSPSNCNYTILLYCSNFKALGLPPVITNRQAAISYCYNTPSLLCYSY